jgi:hypothetical protein
MSRWIILYTFPENFLQPHKGQYTPCAMFLNLGLLRRVQRKHMVSQVDVNPRDNAAPAKQQYCWRKGHTA